MIPKVLHYCFGMSSDFGGKPWSLIHYVCLKSAVERIKPTDVFFYCEYEPTGPWWELTRRMVTIRKIRAPREIFNNPLLHVAHRADVVRLESLLDAGGIYLDADVFVHRDFDDLLGNATVLGEEPAWLDGGVTGLCNAVILSEAQAPFLKRWHSEYRSFRSRGPDRYWNEHSVIIPYALSKQFPHEITILPHSAFFRPTCKPEDIERIFNSAEPIDTSDAYANHLWESFAWERFLEHLTPRRVRAVPTNFYNWARPMIETLPDDYGAPTIMARAARGVRRIRRHGQSATQLGITLTKRAVRTKILAYLRRRFSPPSRS